MPSPGQEETWNFPETEGQALDQCICRFVYRRSEWDWPDPTKKWAFDPPILDHGDFVAWFPTQDEVMKKFVMRILRLMNKVVWNGDRRYGLDACRWSQAGGKIRRSLGGGRPVDPGADIQLNKYYDDSLWDDNLPQISTMETR